MEIALKVGHYAGVAAFLGLALVAPLYFSQARDLRRIRTWMLLTPDRSVAEREAAEAARAAEAEEAAEAAVAAPPARPTPAEPRASVARPPTSAPSETPRPVPGLGQPATPPRGVTPAPGTTPARPLSPAERIALDRPATARITAERAAVVEPPSRARRWLRMPSERGLVLAAAAVLALGVAVVFVVLQSGEETPVPERKGGQAAIDPGEVEVAVLNGTAVPDLAARVGDDVEGGGFQLGTVSNSESPFDNTVVLYAPGSEDEGQAVARELGVARVEQIDAETQAIVEGAPVVVIAGEDRA